MGKKNLLSKTILFVFERRPTITPFFYGSCDFFKNQFRWLEYWYGERVLDIC